MGYYLTPGELAELFTRVQAAMNPGGTLVLCHWRHPIAGWELDGDTVHALARRQLGWPTKGSTARRTSSWKCSWPRNVPGLPLWPGIPARLRKRRGMTEPAQDYPPADPFPPGRASAGLRW